MESKEKPEKQHHSSDKKRRKPKKETLGTKVVSYTYVSRSRA